MRTSLAALLGLVLACEGSPRPAPAPLELCRYQGSFHRDSRQRIEVLRGCHDVSYDEWLCMARALEVLDAELGARCAEGRVAYHDLEARQRSLYAGCLEQRGPEVVACALLSGEGLCLQRRCAEARSRAP